MGIYAIGDPHLSLGVQKPMDVFAGWENYTARLEENWRRKIRPEDTVVLAGDISWGMSLEQAMPDFRFLHGLPGRKIILKGNHDYWWTSMKKMKEALEANGLTSLHLLHNNSYEAEGVSICGSRGWLFESGEAHDEKIINREGMRIEASLKAAGDDSGRERVLFLHYPPLYADQMLEPYLELMEKYGIKRCFYGHIHGVGHRHAIEGTVRGIRYSMISADYLGFDPLRIPTLIENGAD